MKRRLKLLALGFAACLTFGQMFAEDISSELSKAGAEAQKAVELAVAAAEEAQKAANTAVMGMGNSDVETITVTKDGKVTTTTTIKDEMREAYMGIYPKNITMADAKRLGYKNFYGILVSGVVANSPARKFRILKDDIIMYINDEKIKDLNNFNVILDQFFVGDEVTIKVFRNGKEKNVPFVFGARNVPVLKSVSKSYTRSKGRKYSKGNGGGGWVFQHIKPDGLDYINEKFVTALGFSELRDDGLLLNGITGRGNVGNGLMIGGIITWNSEERKINHTIINDLNEEHNVVRGMKFSTGYFGVTVDKRYVLTKNIITSFGAMLGWGSFELDFSQTDGEYDADNINQQMDSSANNFMHLEKNYILFQPRIETLFRINSWFGIRAEAGYMLSYSYHDGWNNVLADDTYELRNSEESKYDGLTISIGPWFGF